ncbi:MAG: hypothetical protein HRF49_03490 [bacterium]
MKYCFRDLKFKKLLAQIVPLFLIAAAQILAQSGPAQARLPYSRKEDKKCYYCHADWKNAPKILTEQGKWYADHDLTFEGMPAELIPGPPEPVPEEEPKPKGPPVGVIIGMGFFVVMIGMIVVSIFKAPVKEVSASDAAAGIDPGAVSDIDSDVAETNGHSPGGGDKKEDGA